MLTLQIHEQEIEITEKAEFVRGTVGVECQVVFDDFWKDYFKTIVFKYENSKPISILVGNLDNIIEILAESGKFKIGAFGTTETETLPTLWSEDNKILYGTDTFNTVPPEYTSSEMQQLLTMVAETKEIAQSVRDDADNGVFDGEQGIQGDKGEKGDKGDKGDKGERGSKGVRGTGILTVTTSPMSYESIVDGKKTTHRISQVTVQSQSGLSAIVGDRIAYKNLLYAVVVINAGYVYLKYLFSMQGSKGEPGQDYILTDADKQEIAGMVKPRTITFTDGATLTIEDNTEYIAETDIANLTIVYPETTFICSLNFTLASEGDITITLPESKYIGGVPSFANGETWELNIKNGVVVGGLIE